MALPPYSDSPPIPIRGQLEHDLPPSYDDITNPDGMMILLAIVFQFVNPAGILNMHRRYLNH